MAIWTLLGVENHVNASNLSVLQHSSPVLLYRQFFQEVHSIQAVRYLLEFQVGLGGRGGQAVPKF